MLVCSRPVVSESHWAAIKRARHSNSACKPRFPLMRGSHFDAVATRPPRHVSSAKWLCDTYTTPKSRTAYAGRIVIPDCFIYSSPAYASRQIEGAWMLQQWVDFWKQDRVKVVVTEGVGFGVVATAKMNTGTSVMEGVVEPNVEEECVLVEPEGSLYGPASLLNAACHDCSSVAFEKRDQIWTAKCQKTNQTRGRVACRIHTKCAGINCMPSVRVPAMWRRSREFYSQTHGKTFN